MSWPPTSVADICDTLGGGPTDIRYHSYGKDLRYLLYEMDSVIHAKNIDDLSSMIELPEKWRAYPVVVRNININGEVKKVARFEMYTWRDVAQKGIFQGVIYSPDYGSIVVMPYSYSAMALSKIIDHGGDTVDLLPLLLQIDRDSVLMPRDY